jgi:hypothetical protein
MVTIIVPTGNYPFFIRACYRNVLETAGVVDFRYLVTSDVSSQTIDTFRAIGANYMVAPIKYSCRGVHLDLLDWAFTQPDVSNWVYIQHCDVFWTQRGWYEEMKRSIASSPETVAFVMPYSQYIGEYKHKQFKFYFNKQKMLRTDDFAGLYNRKALRALNLSFKWGTAKNLVSENLRNIILSRKIRRRDGRLLALDQFLDGSDCIGLELGTQGDHLVKEMEISSPYYHAWDLFGMGYHMSRKGNVLLVDRSLEKSMNSIRSYSWVSSFLFNRHEIKNKIFPWVVATHFLPKLEKPAICSFLERYKDTDQVIGLDDDGIARIKFRDTVWNWIKL